MAKRIDLITDVDISSYLDGETADYRIEAVQAHLAASRGARALLDAFCANDFALRAVRREILADPELAEAVRAHLDRRKR